MFHPPPAVAANYSQVHPISNFWFITTGWFFQTPGLEKFHISEGTLSGSHSWLIIERSWVWSLQPSNFFSWKPSILKLFGTATLRKRNENWVENLTWSFCQGQKQAYISIVWVKKWVVALLERNSNWCHIDWIPPMLMGSGGGEGVRAMVPSSNPPTLRQGFFSILPSTTECP